MTTLCNFTKKDKDDFYAFCKTISPQEVVFREILFTRKDCPTNGETLSNTPWFGLVSSVTEEQVLVPTFTFDSAGNVLSVKQNHLAALPPKDAILRECKAGYTPHVHHVNQTDKTMHVYVVRCTLAPKAVGILFSTDRQQFDYKMAIGRMPILSKGELENEEFQDKIDDRLG